MNQALRFGEFIGRVNQELRTEDFSFTEVIDRVSDVVPKHTHEDAHFNLVTAGAYITTARNISGICPASTLIFNPPGTTHRDRFQTRGGSFFTVSITPKILSRIKDGISLCEYASGLSNVETSWIASRIYREFRTMDGLSPLVMEGLALELLAFTVRQARMPRSYPGWLKLAHELMNDRYAETIRVTEIAQIVGVHPVHLSRTFRQFFGCSPGEFIRGCRLRAATTLLRQSTFPLVEIAIRCGFSDQSQFTKSFNKASGMTPGEFRKLHK